MSDDLRVALRPRLLTTDGKVLTAAPDTAEGFQNKTLRPILKLQHELLCGAWRRYVERQKGSYDKLPSPTAKREYLHHAFQTNREWRAFASGLICGHFTRPEWDAFREKEHELARRLLTMAEERIAEAEGC